jgi:ketosteroid isomerase-like protein
MTRYLLAFLLLFSATATSAAQKDEQAIIDHGRTWAALYEAGKIDEMRPLYEEDAVLMTDGTPKLVGVAAILSFLGRNKERGNSVRMQFFNEDVKVDGRYGFLTAFYWMTITTRSGQTFEARGRSLLVFKKGKKGKWRIWRDMDNKAPDVPPTAP